HEEEEELQSGTKEAATEPQTRLRRAAAEPARVVGAVPTTAPAKKKTAQSPKKAKQTNAKRGKAAEAAKKKGEAVAGSRAAQATIDSTPSSIVSMLAHPSPALTGLTNAQLLTELCAQGLGSHVNNPPQSNMAPSPST